MITTDIAWPSQLPAPLRSDLRLQPVQTFMRTTMESGRARQRRRYTSVPVSTPVSWVMTDGQGTAFEAWFRDAINDGADWFLAPRKTPQGYVALISRFTSMYTIEPFGPKRWRYSAAFEIWDRPISVLPPGWGAFPEYLVGADIIDLAANREWPEA